MGAGEAPPRLLVWGPTGRSELRGGTVGRSSNGTEMKRKEEMRSGAPAKEPRSLGVERWMERRRPGAAQEDNRHDDASLTSEVPDNHACMIFDKTKVTASTWQGREKVGVPGKRFVDPLEMEIGLHGIDGPLHCAKQISKADPVLEYELGSFVGRPIQYVAVGDLGDFSGGTGDGGSGLGPEFCIASNGPERVRSTSGYMYVGALPVSMHSDERVREGEPDLGSVLQPGLLLDGVDFLDGQAKPTTIPPAGFQWQFLANVWVLVLVTVHKDMEKVVEVGIHMFLSRRTGLKSLLQMNQAMNLKGQLESFCLG